MSSAFFPSYKPQVLSRTEGFHLPSPPPSNSPPSPPPTSSQNSSGSNNFDNLFVPPLFSVPDPFRKFPAHSNNDQNGNNMDFSDELASLIATSPTQGHPHNNSHERSTQSPGAYDDYRSHHTHNIFDISAPTSHHQSSHHNHFAHQNPSFSLPPASSLHSANIHGPSSVHSTHPLHEFTAHSHFNSTVPAIGSSMRYEPPSNNPSSPTSGNGNNPFAPPPGEPSSFSSHMSNLSGMSSFTNLTAQSDFHLSQPSNGQANGGQRQTPSPVSANGTAAEFSRSRSRSRAPPNAMDPANPPSTNGGPARRTRTKRNSVSSVSPPPLHRGHTQPLVIPNGTNGAGRGPASPLSLHTSGWFMPQGQGNEFGLPTPESVHGFSAFNGGASLGSVGLGVSPKEVNVPGMGIVGMQKGGETPPDDIATKQALIANEKRRRRRESHNAVERRRRDNINEKISELATLIPECLLDPNGACPSLFSSAARAASAGLGADSAPQIATMTLPVSLSAASGEDLLFGVTINTSADKKEGSGSAEPEDAPNSASTPTTTTGASAANGGPGSAAADANSAVKANKGMILRKSVEYIRYLQQLVSAQANRNRDLEQQLQAFRSGNAPASPVGTVDGDGEMKLHDEVDGFGLLNGSAGASTGANGQAAQAQANGRPRRGSIRKSFHGFDLPSVGEEMDQDTERGDHDHDHEVERPSTAGTGTGVSPGSSMDDDLLDDEGEDGDEGDQGEDDGDEDMEIERGRKGRDGRPVGRRVGRKGKSVSVGAGVKVKKEADRADGMEVVS
ncbi:HLH-domain-containing protein [Lentinus tigrinus ALCF2SS1-7]|uniref:HLH-domain-containing protein n=1 Tax=Lentinus tigrinus ALCF2SS1-6 TaxID=1328759 RepID=A0A5C2S281_9APHY|nr:HLH-domain-containing protein [Lentinus tigrinus ALCF2SS1-6]RPD71816.1 HLH-domain-containing protein [Lentinus tigrinus ALCF2SS1-7]